MASKDSIYVISKMYKFNMYCFLLEANANRTEATILMAKKKLPTNSISKLDDVDEYIGGVVKVEHIPATAEEFENAGPGQIQYYMEYQQGDLKVTQKLGIISKGNTLRQLAYLPKNEKKDYHKIFSGRP